MRKPAFLLLLLCVGACAPAGDFPSLRPRAAEALRPDTPLPPPPPLNPADPAIAARVREIAARGVEGQSAFDAVLPEARAAVSAAGPAESESWTRAQQAISRLDAVRGPAVAALADLDALAVSIGTAGERANNLAAIRAASATLAEVVRRQRETLDALSAALAPA